MRTLPLLLFLAIMTIGAPLASAQDTNYAYGSIAGRGDYDYTPVPAALVASPCWLDDDGDGAYDAGEPIYLDVDSATCAVGVEVNDVRLTAAGAYAAGSLVTAKDSDMADPLTGPLNDDVRYYDVDGNAEWNSKDTLYLDINGATTPTADVGDLRLTKFGTLAAGTIVRAGDPDLATALKEVRTPAFDLMDANILYLTGGGTVFKDGRTVYVNVDAGVLVTADLGVENGDVRLTQTTANPWGLKTKDVQVLGAGFSPAMPVAGQPFQVSVDTKNNGKGPGSAFVTTSLDAKVVDARATPLLASGESATLVMTLLAPPEEGAHTLTVGGVNYQVNVVAGPGGAADVAELRAQIAALAARLDALDAGQLSADATAGTGASAADSRRADAPGLDLVALFAVLGVALVLAQRRMG